MSNAPSSVIGRDLHFTHKRLREKSRALAPNKEDPRHEFADAIKTAAMHAPGGTVISVEGAWGSGKTHVLATVACELARARAPAREEQNALKWAAGCYWLNPWLLAEPDLLGRLCVLLLEDLEAMDGTSAQENGGTHTKEDAMGRRTPTEYARALLPGLVQFALAGAGATLALAGPAAGPLGAILQAVSPAVVSMLERFIDLPAISRTNVDEGDARPRDMSMEEVLRFARPEIAGDPIERMHRDLVDLVHEVRSRSIPEPDASGATAPPVSEKLFVFIDDLDRCLPEVQVRVLQNLHFITQTEAEIVFVIGIDPSLLESSLRTHYRSADMDGDAYLRKLVHLRCAVPDLSYRTVQGLFRPRHLEARNLLFGDSKRVPGVSARGPTVYDVLDELVAEGDPHVGNVRTVDRVFERMKLHFTVVHAKGGGPKNDAFTNTASHFIGIFLAHLMWETYPKAASDWRTNAVLAVSGLLKGDQEVINTLVTRSSFALSLAAVPQSERAWVRLRGVHMVRDTPRVKGSDWLELVTPVSRTMPGHDSNLDHYLWLALLLEATCAYAPFRWDILSSSDGWVLDGNMPSWWPKTKSEVWGSP